ncbi:MAG: DUF1800 family protein [Opitutales bacterium]
MPLNPENAWSPLPAEAWSRDHARHLASRLGFSLRPDWVDQIHRAGARRTVKQAFGQVRSMPVPPALEAVREDTLDRLRAPRADRQAMNTPEMRRQRRQVQRDAFNRFGLDWLAFAREPGQAAQEKRVLVFQNIWAVSVRGVNNPYVLFDHQRRIREGLTGSYLDFCRSLARSPAMALYLDLHRSRRGAPNENFARELFELFTLGEGRYTETDVKEAARALTGYRLDRRGGLRLVPHLHDFGPHTILLDTGSHDLDSLIDLIFEQPAAARFLPRALCRAYLSHEDLPDRLIDPLADAWRNEGFSIPWLCETLFTSQLFYEPVYRGQLIKDPVHYMLGMLQDLDLDVLPLPGRSLTQLRLMGMPFYQPPNVRGWVGGRQWINSATIAARRQFAASLFMPVDVERLNADDQQALATARAAGRDTFTLTAEQLDAFTAWEDQRLAHSLAERFYVDGDPAFLATLLSGINNDRPDVARREAAGFLVAALTAPAYHLC